MSWDADFYIRADGHLVAHGEWNMTHNINPMIEVALGDRVTTTGMPFWSRIAEDRGGVSAMGTYSWWRLLDGLDGAAGAVLLRDVLAGLHSDPARFKALNPENGWGSYARLLPVIQEMHDTSAKFPTGKWMVSG